MFGMLHTRVSEMKRGLTVLLVVGVTLLCVLLSVFIYSSDLFRQTVSVQKSYKLNQFGKATNTDPVKLDHNINWERVFDFVPFGSRDCKRLFPKSNKSFSAEYNSELAKFNDHLKAGNFGILQEGHSQNLVEQSMTYWRIANQSHVHTVCETGFNAGHSTLMWLMANPRVHVYTFDIGQYKHTRYMGEYMTKTYPGRITIIWGNSIKTLPTFLSERPLLSMAAILQS